MRKHCIAFWITPVFTIRLTLGPSSVVPDDKEARIRNLKEKQNEERQKKLEEIKAQALAAQRFKEQKEQERRQRLEELRVKEDIRRLQVSDDNISSNRQK